MHVAVPSINFFVFDKPVNHAIKMLVTQIGQQVCKLLFFFFQSIF